MRMKSFCSVVLSSTLLSVYSAAPLPRSSPESQGVSSRAILDFVEAADQTVNSMHSVMLLRHGQVIAEGWWTPYNAQSPHSLYSLSKSFTSTAVGLAVKEGKLSVDDPVLKFFPEDAPAEPSANLKSMRVRDLLRMVTGHQVEPRLNGSNVWTKTFLSNEVPHKPGTHFLYNTAGTYMLSAIVQKATGSTILDFLKPRLFEPLGIENPSWGSSPQGISLGGYGLSIKTEDIARFGELYLKNGKWNGRQVVPEDWVHEATTRQTSNGSNPASDWDQGYGYQFWRCRHAIYRGDGAFGQYCIVMPEQDAVLAITSGTRDMQHVLNLVWDKLLPGIKQGHLAKDSSSETALKSKLKGLTIPAVENVSANAAPAILGKKFSFSENEEKIESITFIASEGEGTATVIRVKGTDYTLPFKTNWTRSRTAYGFLAEQPVATSGGWTSKDTFSFKICFYETPFELSGTCKVNGEELYYTGGMNLSLGALRKTSLTARAQ
jgi:CubicO group peptidase (beta-lactamase class C family)